MAAIEEFGKKIPDVEYVERPTVLAIIADKHSRFVFVQHHGKYFLPGGGVEAGESLEEALLREVREELGWEVEIGGELVRAGEYFRTPSGTRYVHNQNVFYEVRVVGSADSDIPPEHEPVWLTIDEVRGRTFHESHVWACRQSIHQ